MKSRYTLFSPFLSYLFYYVKFLEFDAFILEHLQLVFEFEQEKELIRLKREAKLKGGFYVVPEAKLLFITRIRGYVSFFNELIYCYT